MMTASRKIFSDRLLPKLLSKFFLGMLLIMPFGLAMTSPALAENPESFAKESESFVESLSQDVTAFLRENGSDRNKVRKKLENTFESNFDIERIGRFVLGPYWRSASKAERKEYLKLFKKYVIEIYAGRFSEYSGEKLAVKETLVNGRYALVRSVIEDPEHNTQIAIDWRVRGEKGVMKVIDVIIEGVSMSVTQRSEFATVIQRNGGEIEGLLKVLRKKTGGSA